MSSEVYVCDQRLQRKRPPHDFTLHPVYICIHIHRRLWFKKNVRNLIVLLITKINYKLLKEIFLFLIWGPLLCVAAFTHCSWLFLCSIKCEVVRVRNWALKHFFQFLIFSVSMLISCSLVNDCVFTCKTDAVRLFTYSTA